MVPGADTLIFGKNQLGEDSTGLPGRVFSGILACPFSKKHVDLCFLLQRRKRRASQCGEDWLYFEPSISVLDPFGEEKGVRKKVAKSWSITTCTTRIAG